MSRVENILVTPLLMALGVDQFKHKKSEYCSWSGLKTFFSEKIKLLEDLSTVKETASAEKLLVSKCAAKIKQSVEKRLRYVQFYKSDNHTDEEKKKIELFPLTNSNCEGEFAELDNDIRRVGGTVSIQTLSNHHLVDKKKIL